MMLWLWGERRDVRGDMRSFRAYGLDELGFCWLEGLGMERELRGGGCLAEWISCGMRWEGMVMCGLLILGC